MALHRIDQRDERKRRAGGGEDCTAKARAWMKDGKTSSDLMRAVPAGIVPRPHDPHFHHTIPCRVVMATPAIIG